MRKLLSLVGAVALGMVGPSMAATLVDEDFETGYADRSLVGQTASSGLPWAQHPSGDHSPLLWGNYGALGSKGAGANVADQSTTGLVLFGKKVTKTDAENIILISCDLRSGHRKNGVAVHVVHSDSPDANWIDIGGMGSATIGQGGCVLRASPIVNSFHNYGAASSEWHHFEASINLSSGLCEFSYYDKYNPVHQGSWTYTLPKGQLNFKPDALLITLYHSAENEGIGGGVDNLKVTTIPQPDNTIMLIMVGGVIGLACYAWRLAVVGEDCPAGMQDS